MRMQGAPEWTQAPLESAAIIKICEGASGTGHGVVAAIELGGGSYSTTYRLERGAGAPLILRVAPPEDQQRPSERHLLRNEYASIPFLRPVADLMPTTLVVDFTRRTIARDFLIQTHLTGTPASVVQSLWPVTSQVHPWRSIGTVLQRIHGVTADVYGRTMAPTASSWSDCLEQQLSAMAGGCDDLGVDASDLRQVSDLIARDREALDLIRPAHLLHGDLIPANVMVDADEPDRGVIGIFDCDRTWWGDPLADWTFAFVDRLAPELRAGFWEGYGRAADLPHGDLRACTTRPDLSARHGSSTPASAISGSYSEPGS